MILLAWWTLFHVHLLLISTADQALIINLNTTSFTAYDTRDNKKNENYAPEFATYDSVYAWCPKLKSGSYLTVDLGQNYIITKVGTKGQYDEWVTSYQLRYKAPDDLWRIYGNFTGNVNAYDSVEHDIVPTEAHQLRFYPNQDDDKSYTKEPTLRVEAWGYLRIESTTYTTETTTDSSESTESTESTTSTTQNVIPDTTQNVLPDTETSYSVAHMSTIILILVAAATVIIPIICFKMYQKRKMHAQANSVSINVVGQRDDNDIEAKELSQLFKSKRILFNKILLQYGSNYTQMKTIEESNELSPDRTNSNNCYMVENIELCK